MTPCCSPLPSPPPSHHPGAISALSVGHLCPWTAARCSHGQLCPGEGAGPVSGSARCFWSPAVINSIAGHNFGHPSVHGHKDIYRRAPWSGIAGPRDRWAVILLAVGSQGPGKRLHCERVRFLPPLPAALSLVLVQPFPPWTGILLSAGSEDTGASRRLSGRTSSSSRRGPRSSSAVGRGICGVLRHPRG